MLGRRHEPLSWFTSQKSYMHSSRQPISSDQLHRLVLATPCIAILASHASHGIRKPGRVDIKPQLDMLTARIPGRLQVQAAVLHVLEEEATVPIVRCNKLAGGDHLSNVDRVLPRLVRAQHRRAVALGCNVPQGCADREHGQRFAVVLVLVGVDSALRLQPNGRLEAPHTAGEAAHCSLPSCRTSVVGRKKIWYISFGLATGEPSGLTLAASNSGMFRGFSGLHSISPPSVTL